MAVFAIFTYEVKLGRINDFMAKQQMPSSIAKLCLNQCVFFKTSFLGQMRTRLFSLLNMRIWRRMAHVPHLRTKIQNGSSYSAVNRIRRKFCARCSYSQSFSRAELSLNTALLRKHSLYHGISRTVRRACLCRADSYSGWFLNTDVIG